MPIPGPPPYTGSWLFKAFWILGVVIWPLLILAFLTSPLWGWWWE